VRAALAADTARAAGKSGADAIVSAARSLDTRLAALASGPQGGFGPANRDLARHLEDIDFADMSPTQSNITAVETNCREIDAASAALSQAQSSIQSMDALLKHAGMQALPALRAPAAGACTVHEVK
jgi:NADP-dependent 3-hydroxy acid dehydrogenase YdfG